MHISTNKIRGYTVAEGSELRQERGGGNLKEVFDVVVRHVLFCHLLRVVERHVERLE